MTFNFAPWAIDGARSRAGLARLASYAAGGGRSGVIKPADLRVSALAVPGNGVRITSGGAVVLNGYLSDPDEAYVVSNPASHTVLAADMPPPQPATSYYLVCVVIGDPEFNQTGHPFMPSGPLDPAVAADFEYVRVVVVPCPPGTSSFEQLGYDYPAYALARLEVPANTSTITNAMIVDLRELSQARTHREVLMNTAMPNQDLTAAEFTTFPGFAPTIKVPEWATKVMLTASLDGIWVFPGSVVGELRVGLGTLVGASLGYDVDAVNYERRGYRLALGTDVTAVAGQTLQLYTQGRRTGGDSWLGTVDGQSVQIVYDVQFYESII